MGGGRILIVDDDVSCAGELRGALARRGYVVGVVASGADALAWLHEHPAELVLAHARMAPMSGVELCAELHVQRPGLPTIVVTGDSSLEGAVAAIRAGVFDYIAKPIDLVALTIAIERAIGQVTLRRELARVREQAAVKRPIASLVGTSAGIRGVVELIHKVADSDATVLIVGESGTGKELVARALHDSAGRRALPFAAINCGAVPAHLLESELFGHVKGAFTDAQRTRPGLIAGASGGTVFLDEIGEMSLEMQVKLLRVLQERRVRPVGSDEEVPFAARVIAATNRDLESAVAAHRFREDLYYRINVVQIRVPPLRARASDILLLAQHFIDKIAARSGKPAAALGAEAARLLLEYTWPGNVRELENCIERAMALCSGDEIEIAHLPDRIKQLHETHPPVTGASPLELLSLAELEHRHVRRVLEAVGGNKTMAATILGIDRRSLYRRLAELDPASPQS
ncbi:MAG: sigma-54 dependent transcriptional regulator [Deltaproteobacteria bacterium]|nr:sigma-54 dependent transcriptional regulator [Deltaproteobacteria bacterium]